MTSKLLLSLAALLLSSCVTGTIEVPRACSVNKFATIPAGFPVPNGRLAVESTHDMSKPISEIAKFGDTKIDLLDVSFSSTEGADLSFIRTMRVDFVRNDGSLEHLADVSVTDPTNKVTFKTSVSSRDFSEAMKNGPVKFNVSGEVISPSAPVTPIFEVCVMLTSNVSGNITDVN